MACACGFYHTITLSDDGTVHSFGRNNDGQLGLGHKKDVSLPTPIPNLPKITLISCGPEFTVCVDHEGFMWSFGNNTFGQLGIGSTSNSIIPKRIDDLPPIRSVSCGSEHTLILTNDENLWAVGNNANYQLCLENNECQLTPKQTQFSNIIRISASKISIFQNNEGEIFGCGLNSSGELGLGHCLPQKKVSLIPNLPSNIIQFCCGCEHVLYLDKEGNVYSVGYNFNGVLGLGHNNLQNVLNRIPNIPPIKMISCSFSSYLLDFDGDIWSFGSNSYGQLGIGDFNSRNTPTKLLSVTNIKQFSYGVGRHFFAKDEQNILFSVGNDEYGQLGTGQNTSLCTPQTLNREYSTIWGQGPSLISKAKSARK